MTVKDGIVSAGVAVVNGAKAACAAIESLPIGVVIRAGLFVGAAAVVIAMAARKYITKFKLWRKSQSRAKAGDDHLAVADVASDYRIGNYDRSLADVDDSDLLYGLHLNARKKVEKNTRGFKNVSRADRSRLRDIQDTLNQAILGDDYDPDMDYYDATVTRELLDMPKKVARKRRQDDFLDHHTDSRKYVMWRMLHPGQTPPGYTYY